LEATSPPTILKVILSFSKVALPALNERALDESKVNFSCKSPLDSDWEDVEDVGSEEGEVEGSDEAESEELLAGEQALRKIGKASNNINFCVFMRSNYKTKPYKLIR
jgi:hypothetical protein